MSHIEKAKTTLAFAHLPALLGNQEALAEDPCMKLLRQACTLVAKQYGGEVKPYYYNIEDEAQPVNTGLAVHIPIPMHGERPGEYALPRGIGLVIDEQSGTLTFLGDPWGIDRNFYAQVQKLILQKYTALSHAAVLRHMGYQIALQEEAGQIHVTAMR